MSVLNTFQYKQLEFLAAQLSVDAKMLKTCLSKLHNLCYFMIAHFIHKKNFTAPFYRWGSTASRLQSHYEETVYFLPLSFREIPGTNLINLVRMKD